MEILRELTAKERENAYYTVFSEAFPPEELKPLRSIVELTEAGVYRSLGLFQGATPLGYICLWMDGPYILIDYLCVPAAGRNHGTGARLIRATLDAYPDDCVFIGEVEAPTGDPERDAMILRRLNFYARTGARTLAYDTALFGVHYRTIAWSRGPLDEEEILRRHQLIYRSRFRPQDYDDYIQIPLHPGEAVKPPREWRQ